MNRSDLLNDLRTGFLVSIVALPLCLGISMASGFPAAAGLVTAIIAGLFASWFGGARLSIKGPAAGLIVIVLAGVMELGGGDPAIGYPKLLAAIAVSGLLQVILGMLRLGRFSAIIPPSVVHGMLAGIGVIIFAKQFPVMLGVAPIAKSPLGLIAEIPHTIANLNPAVAGLGMVSLFIMLGYGRLPAQICSRIPPQLVALAVAVPASFLLDFSHAHDLIVSGEHFKVGPQYLVRIPADIVKSLGFPEWRSLLDPLTWKFVALLTMVGSAESLLTVHAVDALDPRRQVSDNDADLIAIGVGNFLPRWPAACP